METSSPNLDSNSSIKSSGLLMENPFSLKVGQVFTGIGVGCGVGIGFGRPIYLGAIPAFQQVMTAARGATDVFSGVGRHVNSSIKKLGVKSIEAGVGCGVGIGHGFGVGIALKPGVVQRIQSSIGQAMTKIMMSVKILPSLSSIPNMIPSSIQSNIGMLSGQSGRNVQSATGGLLELANKTVGGMIQESRIGEGFERQPTLNASESKDSSSKASLVTRTEKVISNFLQNPLLTNTEETELNDLAGKLRAENNVLQVLLKHQEVIEELRKENEKLQQILVEDLKIPSSKFHASYGSRLKSNDPCQDCFECRRKNRNSR